MEFGKFGELEGGGKIVVVKDEFFKVGEFFEVCESPLEGDEKGKNKE